MNLLSSRPKITYFCNKAKFNTSIRLDQFNHDLCSYVPQNVVDVRADKCVTHYRLPIFFNVMSLTCEESFFRSLAHLSRFAQIH